MAKKESKKNWKDKWNESWEHYKLSFTNPKELGIMFLYSSVLIGINLLIYLVIYLWLKNKAPIYNPYIINPQLLNAQDALMIKEVFQLILQMIIVFILWVILAIVFWSFVKNAQWSRIRGVEKQKVFKTILFAIVFGLTWVIAFGLLFLIIILLGGGVAMLQAPTFIVLAITYPLFLILLLGGIQLGYSAYYHHAEEKKIWAPIGKSFKSFKQLGAFWREYVFIAFTLVTLDLFIRLITFFKVPELYISILSIIMLVIFFTWARYYITSLYKKLKL